MGKYDEPPNYTDNPIIQKGYLTRSVSPPNIHHLKGTEAAKLEYLAPRLPRSALRSFSASKSTSEQINRVSLMRLMRKWSSWAVDTISFPYKKKGTFNDPSHANNILKRLQEYRKSYGNKKNLVRMVAAHKKYVSFWAMKWI